MKDNKVFISIGSNIKPKHNISKALDILQKEVAITGISTFYSTPPVGNQNQSRFINGVISINTRIKPRYLKFNILRKIEKQLGRKRTGDKNAPRSIDLDLILYNDLVCKEEDLILPDPHILKYDFISYPLLEIEQNIIMPDTGQRLDNLLKNDRPANLLKPLNAYTKFLKMRFIL